MRWADFLEMLRSDGVSLDEIEHDAVAEDGRVMRSRMLTRRVEGKFLCEPFPYDWDDDDEVPKYFRRRVANALRLPVERYVFPDD